MEHLCAPVSLEAAHLGPLLGHAAHLARERMDARMSRFDMTPAQTHTLLYLCRREGSVPQREVVAHLRVKPSTANGILDRMEEKGLIRRMADAADQRQKRVEPTEKGRKLKELAQDAFVSAEDVLVRGMRSEEAETLRHLLYRVIENLEEDRTQC